MSDEATFSGPITDTGDASLSASASPNPNPNPSSSSSTTVKDPNAPKEVFTQSLPVPEHKMGWIIGKAGININNLSKKSGANISVSDSTSLEFGIKWNYIQITGNGRAVDRAKKLILLRLERLDATGNDMRMHNTQQQQYGQQTAGVGVGGGGYHHAAPHHQHQHQHQQQQQQGGYMNPRMMGSNGNMGSRGGPRNGPGPMGGGRGYAQGGEAAHHDA